LKAKGFRSSRPTACKRGLIEAGTRRPDLVVLDLGLPDGDGIDFIRDLRTWSEMPVIVLSARNVPRSTRWLHSMPVPMTI
jgi:two-component system KDP operon response regulator KdpE